MRKKSIAIQFPLLSLIRFDGPPPQTAGATIKQLTTRVRSKFSSVEE
jgi:hypothetical protein